MRNTEYLPINATTALEIIQYYTVRTTEMGAKLISISTDPDCVWTAAIEKDGNTYYSIYIPPELRGLGLIKNYLHLPIITVKSCGIIDTLDHLGFNYTVVEGWFDSFDYAELKWLYGDSLDDNGEFRMWHVTSKCRELEDTGYSEEYILNYLKNLNDNFVY